jgi:two-component system phosphate regulon sensor histidine kinase PhoR
VPPSLWREVWILAAIALGSLALGALTGRYFIVAGVGFGLYIVLQLQSLTGLYRWLTDREHRDIPDAEGLWGDTFNEIRKLVRAAEQRQGELAGQVNRLQSVAAAMPDAVVILSAQDEIEWANDVARQLLGVHYPRDAGMRLGNLIRDPEFAEYLHRGDFREPLALDLSIDPPQQVAIQLFPYGDSQKLLMGRDVTHLARIEQMRRHFVANVSHELRTPLTVLGGYIETLQQIPRIEPKDLHKHLHTMAEQTSRMQRLVDDLLALSRLETAPPRRHEETVDVPALIASLREFAEVLSGKQAHRIVVEVNAALSLRGSREELYSAFSNLVNNAIRHTPAGGTIRLRWNECAGGACFSVTDTGEGIAAEHLPHLTERFYRVDTARSRATGGTGLGLSIVKHVLVRHEARLNIESRPGEGSTFTCLFPASRVVRRAA